MRHLLDVNVLLALMDEAHLHRGRVTKWYAGLLPDDLICTCAITELGLVRTMLNVGTQPTLESALIAFSEFKKSSRLKIEFIADDLGVEVMPAYVKTARQTTDGHLLMLAAKHGARLATLDNGIPGALLLP